MRNTELESDYDSLSQMQAQLEGESKRVLERVEGLIHDLSEDHVKLDGLLDKEPLGRAVYNLTELQLAISELSNTEVAIAKIMATKVNAMALIIGESVKELKNQNRVLSERVTVLESALQKYETAWSAQGKV